MTIQVKLTPALEKFAEDLVAEGRYADIDAVVRSSLTLLQSREAERLALRRSIDEAIAESERDGYVTLDELMVELDAIIEAAEAEQAAAAHG
ncbi:type II toxin-antitoxin system ParD family antitoxin [Caulobacter sp. 602-2]|uniref:Type II toxin-antitoxin system ParD family antitoxin n=1 Tax=Caulobacter sp. 602-2 TaxID=2710887 RepID=A0A6G4QX48_9CAUL|nr:type II toxin-antitoxin system ParD family antitoxin [Caulobacter sp. 602-2]NGM50226.1 type II toxin-antitoxin system ParD family antitoxin [Caulobacter sp. 602-2]